MLGKKMKAASHGGTESSRNPGTTGGANQDTSLQSFRAPLSLPSGVKEPRCRYRAPIAPGFWGFARAQNFRIRGTTGSTTGGISEVARRSSQVKNTYRYFLLRAPVTNHSCSAHKGCSLLTFPYCFIRSSFDIQRRPRAPNCHKSLRWVVLVYWASVYFNRYGSTTLKNCSQ